MPTMIKVLDLSTGQGIILDKAQVLQVEAELTRVLPNMEPVDALITRVASDCDITVAPDGQAATKYKLYGRSVLVNVDADTMTQFYMGLLILEWLRR